MYDLPWLHPAIDELWSALAARLTARGIEGVPATLERNRALPEIWRDPALLLAQTCGYPLTHTLGRAVRLVSTPCYAFPGCTGGWHRSIVLLRAGHPATTLAQTRGARLAVNSPDSNTGMNLMRAAIAPFANGSKFFSAVRFTGSHLASIAELVAGEADLAAIDCVTYGLATRDRPELLAGTRRLAETEATPGLPLITSCRTTAAELAHLRAALAETAADPHLAETRRSLGLVGFAPLPRTAYRAVRAAERKAAARGYKILG